MIKADASFYFVNFVGDKLDRKNAEKFLTEAAYIVFNYTYGRTGRKNLTEFQIDMVKRAICAQAEILYKQSGAGASEEASAASAGNISSYSADGVSITFDRTVENAIAIANNSRVPEKVKNFLMPTGLINRTLFT